MDRLPACVLSAHVLPAIGQWGAYTLGQVRPWAGGRLHVGPGAPLGRRAPARWTRCAIGQWGAYALGQVRPWAVRRLHVGPGARLGGGFLSGHALACGHARMRTYMHLSMS
eukprot:355607-Chlamydomonas_euryale.AAC.7